MKKHGKKYLAAAAKVDIQKNYTAEEAVALVKETSISKFGTSWPTVTIFPSHINEPGLS